MESHSVIHRIEIHEDWEVVGAFNPVENEQAERGDPVSVASCPDGRIAVSNPAKKCVLVFSRNGTYSKSLFFPGAKYETRFFRPGKVLVTLQDHIYVVNHAQVHRTDRFVNVFDLNDTFIHCLKENILNLDNHDDNVILGGTGLFKVYSQSNGTLVKIIPFKGYQASNSFAVNTKGDIIAQTGDKYTALMVAIDCNGTELFAIDLEDTIVVSIDTDADDNIYLLTNDTLWQYNSAGRDKRCIARMPTRYREAKSMTISSHGEIIVLVEDKVFVFKLKGT